MVLQALKPVLTAFSLALKLLDQNQANTATTAVSKIALNLVFTFVDIKGAILPVPGTN